MTVRQLPFTYAPGYPMDSDQPDDALIDQACRNAQTSDVAIIFGRSACEL